jgi:hypothetical protein
MHAAWASPEVVVAAKICLDGGVAGPSDGTAFCLCGVTI